MLQCFYGVSDGRSRLVSAVEVQNKFLLLERPHSVRPKLLEGGDQPQVHASVGYGSPNNWFESFRLSYFH
uniref:Uncharacterized protein n=1 Tax=Arundo donax TaxID=35708 RepID=A0A0A9FJV7_ARUDO